MKKSLSILLLAVLASASAVRADDAEPRRPHPKCGPEAKTLCQGIQPGQGRIVNCLVAKIDSIQDPTCKQNVMAVKARQDAIRQACGAEAAACSGMDFGSGLIKCIAKSKPSEGCRAALKQNRRPRPAPQQK